MMSIIWTFRYLLAATNIWPQLYVHEVHLMNFSLWLTAIRNCQAIKPVERAWRLNAICNLNLAVNKNIDARYALRSK